MKAVLEFIHHLFIPKEENNYRAKALHTDFLSFYLVLALVLTFTFKQFNLSNVLGFATDISVNKLYELTNNERIKNNLPPLTINNQLSQAAALKAQDMFAKNYWSHYSPDGGAPWDFILQTGYQYEYAGENLAKNFLFSQGVIDGWMNSPTHKDNVLKKDYTEVGFAVVNGTLNNEPTTLVVQMFGKQLGSAPLSNILPPPSVKAEEVVPEKVVIVPSPATIAQKTTSKTSPITNIPFNLNAVFLCFLLLALGLDLYFASKYNIVRIGGKNLAHIIFIGFICFGLLIFSKGMIL